MLGIAKKQISWKLLTPRVCTFSNFQLMNNVQILFILTIKITSNFYRNGL